MERTSQWIFSHEIPSDIIVHVAGVPFSLHKFPLVSKCGFIRKLVSESSDADPSDIEIPDVPGGAEAFELAAKFCYGINFEIGTNNIATLRCVAEYLEMTEDCAIGNLVGRTETYLTEVALKSLGGAVSVLHATEDLLPIAENIKLVNQCIDAIAALACKESQIRMSGKADTVGDGVYSPSSSHSKPIDDWWAEDLIVLRIDFFQRVLIAMMARGFKQYALGPILMLYAQKSLRGLDMFGKGRRKIEPKQEHEKRVVLETIVSLLPKEKNAMSVSFLAMLLRSAIYLETTVSCRLDLEKRIALQLEQAVLDDLLIPSFFFTGDTLFDVDTVQRIMMNYLECDESGNHNEGSHADEVYVLPPQNSMERIGRLMESYLAEIASDRNLTVLRFVSLAECIPEQSRATEDGMYRAIDIYLKAHPALSDMERKKVCSVMDCQKLTREACAHAAQNDRLPVQTVVQVLYYEQQRLREMLDGNLAGGEFPAALAPRRNVNSIDIRPVPDDFSNLHKENQELKLEMAKMKMQLKDVKKPTARWSLSTPFAVPPSVDKPPLSRKSFISSPLAVPQSADKPPLQRKSFIGSPLAVVPPSTDKPSLPRKSFMSSVSKKLWRLSLFSRADGTTPPNKGRNKPGRDRRHSVS